MPGFGYGPFGHVPFGHWKWSERMLYDYIPELYRVRDTSGLLRQWSEGVRESFDHLRDLVRDYGDLRDPLQVRTQFGEVYRLVLGLVLLPQMPIEQRGVDGLVNTFREFVTSTARFTDDDEGKELTVWGSTVDGNNRKVTVARLVNATTVLTDPYLTTDTSGKLRWELRAKALDRIDRITVQVRSGDVSRIHPDCLLNDGLANFTVLARRQFPKVNDQRKLSTEREAQDGTISALGYFVSTLLAATQRDVGKKLTVAGSATEANNGKFEVVEVIDPYTMRLDTTLIQDTGPLTWAILPFAELDLQGKAIPRGVVEQEGVDLAINGVTVSSPTFVLAAGDVGKLLTIRGAVNAGTNDTFEIATIINQNSATLSTAAKPIETGLTWELRSRTAIGNLRQVDVRAPSLITLLAPDFGIEVDTQENEGRQRSWVANVCRWLDMKGLAKAYQILGLISGFDVQVQQIFRITQEIAAGLPSANVFAIGDASPGKAGSNGSLIAGSVRFTAPTARFTALDIGRQIRLRNSGSGNDGYYTIVSMVVAISDPRGGPYKTVEFRPFDLATVPDANNGTLQWSVVRLYTDIVPEFARCDEINGDLLTDIVDDVPPYWFTVDGRADEPFYSTTVGLTVWTVVSTTYTGHFVKVIGTVAHPDAPEVITGTSNWSFTDAGGKTYYVESVPVLTGEVHLGLPVYGFYVVAYAAPAVGAASIIYHDPIQFLDGFTSTYMVLATIIPGSISSESGVAIEQALERVLLRLRQVTPAHVQLVPKYVQNFEALYPLSAEIEFGMTSIGGLIAPFTALYDELAGDDVVPDTAVVLATVETP